MGERKHDPAWVDKAYDAVWSAPHPVPNMTVEHMVIRVLDAVADDIATAERERVLAEVETLGAAVAKARTTRGLSMREAAEQIGLSSVATLHRVEHEGSYAPKTLPKILRWLWAEPVAPVPAKATTVPDLLAALQKSIEAAKVARLRGGEGS